MKKTIATFAITAASANAFALYAPTAETKNICLSLYQNENNTAYVGTCDETKNNEFSKLPVLENGCAVGQVSMQTTRAQGQKEFNIKIYPCLAPNIAQL
jgi:hypothetical protein